MEAVRVEEVAKRKMFDQVRGADIAKLDLEEIFFGPNVKWEKTGVISICGYCNSRSNNTLHLRVTLKVELSIFIVHARLAQISMRVERRRCGRTNRELQTKKLGAMEPFWYQMPHKGKFRGLRI